MDDQLTPEEEAAVERTLHEMRFYDKYKEFMGEVKGIFLREGPDQARNHIKSKADDLLQIACDEMFWSLFTKL